jgi:hypothetical protein
MVLVSYFNYITGLEEHCPLHILALVARGQKLTVTQKRLYFKLCHHIAPAVFTKSISAGSCPRVKKVYNGVLGQMSCETFDEWLDYESMDSKHQEIIEHRGKPRSETKGRGKSDHPKIQT